MKQSGEAASSFIVFYDASMGPVLTLKRRVTLSRAAN
jgi:hypothetical protein